MPERNSVGATRQQATRARSRRRSPRVALRLLPGALACAACLLLPGCLFRRMTIRSNPPGALVLIDGREIGYTPVSTDFTYYGTREITLIKDGYETFSTMQPVPIPWYQRFPLDFVSDNMLPFKVTNRHEFLYALQPQQVVPTDALLDRAKGLRSEARLPE